MPLAVVKHREAPRRRRGAADHMDNDVDSAKPLHNSIRNSRTALGGGDIRRDEIQIGRIPVPAASSGEDPRPAFTEPQRYGLADTFGPARHQNTLAVKLEWVDFEFRSHRGSPITRFAAALK